MFCYMCGDIRRQCKTLEIQHKQIIRKLIKSINEELAQWICEPCEKGLWTSYKMELEREARNELLSMQMEKQKLRQMIQEMQNNIPNQAMEELQNNLQISNKQADPEDIILKHEPEEFEQKPINQMENVDDQENLSEFIDDLEEPQTSSQSFQRANSLMHDVLQAFAKYSNASTMDAQKYQDSNSSCSTVNGDKSILRTSSTANETTDVSATKKKYAFIENENSYICNICPSGKSRMYNAKVNVQKHIRYKHLPKNLPPMFTCKTCSFKTKNEEELRNHWKIEHATITCALTVTTNSTQMSEACSTIQLPAELLSYKHYYHKVNESYKCTICSKIFKYQSNAIEHVKLKHFQFRYTCKYCNSQFNCDRSLRKHAKQCAHKVIFD